MEHLTGLEHTLKNASLKLLATRLYSNMICTHHKLLGIVLMKRRTLSSYLEDMSQNVVAA